MNSKLEKFNAFVVGALRGYWNLFLWPPLMAFTIVFCSIALIVGIADTVQHPANLWHNVPLILGAIAVLFVRRVRVFVWAYVCTFFTWVVMLGLALAVTIGPHHGPWDPKMKAWYFVSMSIPPFLVTAYTDYLLHRRPNQTAGASVRT